MATIICQRCGEKTSTAICSSCGYINDTKPQETNNHQSGNSFAFFSHGGCECDGYEAFQAYKSQKTNKKTLNILKAIYIISTIAFLILLFSSFIFVGLAKPSTGSQIVIYISTGVCVILSGIVSIFVLAHQIIDTFAMRSFCKENSLIIRKPSHEMDKSIHLFNAQKATEQAEQKKRAGAALSMYNAYRLTKSVKNIVVFSIYLGISGFILYGTLTSLAPLPILSYFFVGTNYGTEFDLISFIFYIGAEIFVGAILMIIPASISLISVKITEKIANAIMDK